MLMDGCVGRWERVLNCRKGGKGNWLVCKIDEKCFQNKKMLLKTKKRIVYIYGINCDI